MKIFIIGALVVSGILASCSNSTSEKEETSKTPPTAENTTDTIIKQADPTPEKAVISIEDIIDSYITIKNALANDNSKNAATGGESLVKSFAAFNKSGLTADQLKIYADLEEDAKEHAEHISANSGNLKHQREHFETLSKDVYQLVKTFGTSKQLYYDHCPMYNDGKGADWISEKKQIANPYYGKSMATCGSVKEVLT